MTTWTDVIAAAVIIAYGAVCWWLGYGTGYNAGINEKFSVDKLTEAIRKSLTKR